MKAHLAMQDRVPEQPRTGQQGSPAQAIRAASSGTTTAASLLDLLHTRDAPTQLLAS